MRHKVTLARFSQAPCSDKVLGAYQKTQLPYNIEVFVFQWCSCTWYHKFHFNETICKFAKLFVLNVTNFSLMKLFASRERQACFGCASSQQQKWPKMQF